MTDYTMRCRVLKKIKRCRRKNREWRISFCMIQKIRCIKWCDFCEIYAPEKIHTENLKNSLIMLGAKV